MLVPSVLTAIRQAQALFLSADATRRRLTLVPTPTGGSSKVYTEASFPCRIGGPSSSPRASKVADRVGATSIETIYFAYDADVKNGDELIINFRHFTVIDTVVQTDNTLTVTYCTEVH